MSAPGLTATAATARTPRSLLRTALLLDAAVTAANGAAYLVAAGPLADLLGLPAGTLRGAGAFLLAFAVLVALTGRRAAPPRAAVVAVIAVNAGWVAASVVAALAGWGSPATAGTVWVLLQAGVVAAFAELQLAGLRRDGRR